MTPEEINDKRFQRIEMDITALRTDVNIILTTLGLPTRGPRGHIGSNTPPVEPSRPTIMAVVKTG